jgi:hypothetical protein
MTPEKELKVAYGLAIVLLIVGFLSFAASSAKPPEEPVRKMFKTVAGKVLFDHKTHTSNSGYGVSCKECHHHPEGDEKEALRACGDCHQAPTEDAPVPKSCLDCHETDDIDGIEMSKKSDAFHSQCEACHKGVGAGPEENRCSWCHVQ